MPATQSDSSYIDLVLIRYCAPRKVYVPLARGTNFIDNARPRIPPTPRPGARCISPRPPVPLCSKRGHIRKPYTDQREVVIAPAVGATFSGVSALDPGEMSMEQSRNRVSVARPFNPWHSTLSSRATSCVYYPLLYPWPLSLARGIGTH